jgi:hypothetical protein
MGKSDQESIAATIRRASEEPDDTGGASSPIPQLFGQDFPIPPGEDVVSDVPRPKSDERQIPNLPQYDLKSHIRRFVMGQQQVGVSQKGQPEYEERDDSAEYEALMDDCLTGNSALRWEEKNHLRDGTLVISVCFFTKKEKPKVAEGDKSDPLYDTSS